MTACKFKIDNIASNEPMAWELIDNQDTDPHRHDDGNLAATRSFLMWIAGRVAIDDPWGSQNRSFQLGRSYEYYGEGQTLRLIANNLNNITHGTVDRQINRFTKLAITKEGNHHLKDIIQYVRRMLSEDDFDSISMVFFGLIDLAPRERSSSFEPFSLILTHHNAPSSALELRLIETGCLKSDIRKTARLLSELNRYMTTGEEQ